MAGSESRLMCGRGPDGTPRVIELDADGYLAGMSEALADLDFLTAMDRREKIYPWDSIGVAVAGGALSTWGACVVIIPIDGIREDYGHIAPPVGDLTIYGLNGLSLISTANPANALTWRLYRLEKATEITLSADSGAAHAPATWVRMADTSNFMVGDTVWLVDDNTTDGELGVISTITTNDHLVLNAALTLNFTVAQNAKAYLARRGGSGYTQNRVIWGKYSAGGVNNMRHVPFYRSRLFAAGDGLLVEAYDLANVGAPGQVAITAYYDDHPGV